MKIGKFYWFWERKNESIRKYKTRLSELDDERLNKYIFGYYHFVRKSRGRKPLFNLPPPLGEDCQPETCAGQCQGMNSKPECPKEGE